MENAWFLCKVLWEHTQLLLLQLHRLLLDFLNSCFRTETPRWNIAFIGKHPVSRERFLGIWKWAILKLFHLSENKRSLISSLNLFRCSFQSLMVLLSLCFMRDQIHSFSSALCSSYRHSNFFFFSSSVSASFLNCKIKN